MDIASTPPSSAPPQQAARDDSLRAAATRLEATFLSEMLKAAKVGEPRGAFGGGIGEEQVSSMLRDRLAEQLTQAGGIGLGERLFQALRARDERP